MVSKLTDYDKDATELYKKYFDHKANEALAYMKTLPPKEEMLDVLFRTSKQKVRKP